MDKPKEYWIFPRKGNDCEWTNLYPDASWKSETKPLVHVIEYSAYEQLQSKVSELEDKLYHESRKAPEVEYKLVHEIEVLKKQLELCRKTLKRISEDRCVDVSGKVTKFETWTAELARECLFKLEKE